MSCYTFLVLVSQHLVQCLTHRSENSKALSIKNAYRGVTIVRPVNWMSLFCVTIPAHWTWFTVTFPYYFNFLCFIFHMVYYFIFCPAYLEYHNNQILFSITFVFNYNTKACSIFIFLSVFSIHSLQYIPYLNLLIFLWIGWYCNITPASYLQSAWFP